MLTILANSFLTATRHDGEIHRRETARQTNPLRNVRTGGLILVPDEAGKSGAPRGFRSAPKAPRAGL